LHDSFKIGIDLKEIIPILENKVKEIKTQIKELESF